MIRDGHVALARPKSTNQSTGKLRPILIVRRLPGRHDDWLVCMISSQISQRIVGFDEIINETDEDFAQSGLRGPSLIRIGRLAVLEHREIVGSIGRISDHRLDEIKRKLGNWIRQSPA